MFVYVGIMYFWIVKTLFTQRRTGFYQTEGEEDVKVKWRASMRLSRYPLIFVILWIIPIINRSTYYLQICDLMMHFPCILTVIVENWAAGDDGVFALVLLHTICVSIQGTINSVVYCHDEHVFSNCSPHGLKARAEFVVSAEKRKTMELQPYELKHDEQEEELPVGQPKETVTEEERKEEVKIVTVQLDDNT
jgi:hypothetical protein